MHKATFKIPLILFFIFYQSPGYPQAFNDIEWYDVDSLLTVLPAQKGKERLHTLNSLAASLSFEDAQKCRYYANEALSLSEELNDGEGTAAAIRNFGRMAFYNGNYPKTLNYYHQALLMYEELGNLYMVAQTLEDIATTHFFAKDFDKTFKIMKMALEVYRQKDENGNTVGSVRDTMTIYSRVGLPYRYIGRSDTSVMLYLKYLEVGEKNNFEITDMMLHNGLLAMCYYENRNYDSSFYYFRQAANYPDVNMSIRALKHEHMRRMAGIHLVLKNTDTAVHFFKASFKWFSERGFLKQSQMAARQLGDIYYSLGNLTGAEYYFMQSEALLKEMISKRSYYRYDSLKYIVSWGTELYFPFTKKLIKEKTYEQAILLFDHIHKLYLERNQLRKAITYLTACSNAKDTLRVLVRNRESIEIQTKYETEQKDKEIYSLSHVNKLQELQLIQSRWMLVGLGGVVLLIILFAIILIRQNKLRNSRQTLLFQQRLLRTQMNPHFLFNSLSSIQNFVIQENPIKASDYLSRFAKLVRQILNNSVEEYVLLEDEISSIENYIELQKIRYRDMFDYSIKVDKEIDPETILIPPMLAQPFIENSIEHGFKHKDSMGNMKIRFRSNDKLIRFEVEDDGIGRENAMEILKEQNKGHRSMATDITRDRLRVLNKKLRQKIKLTITDLKDKNGNSAGTKVTFDIPFKN